ncbi:MAG TPA: flagellar hook-length control protein FliK [Alphaproteobacteria bacterium]
MVTDIRFLEMLSPRDGSADPARPRTESGESTFADLLNQAIDTPAVPRRETADDRSAQQATSTTAATEPSPVAAPVQPQQDPATPSEPTRATDTTPTTPAAGVPESVPSSETMAPRQAATPGAAPSAPSMPPAPPTPRFNAAGTVLPPTQTATAGPQMASTLQSPVMSQADGAILSPPTESRAPAPSAANAVAPSTANTLESNTNGRPHLEPAPAMPTGAADRRAQAVKPTVPAQAETGTGSEWPVIPEKTTGSSAIASQPSPTRRMPAIDKAATAQPVSTQSVSIQLVSTQPAASPAQAEAGNSPLESISVPEAVARTRTATNAPAVTARSVDKPLTDVVGTLPATDDPSVEVLVNSAAASKPDMPTRVASNLAPAAGFATQITAQATANGDATAQAQTTGAQPVAPQLAAEIDVVGSTMSQGEQSMPRAEQQGTTRIDQAPVAEASVMRGSPSIDVAAAAERAARPALHPLVAQVAVHVTKAAIEGNDRISIRLSPAELGRIDVRLDFSPDGRVQAVFAADRPHTVELLQRDARDLARALQDAGLQTDSGSLSFNLRNGGHGNDAGGFERSILGAGREDGDIVVQVPPPQVHAYAAGMIGPGRVDIRI